MTVPILDVPANPSADSLEIEQAARALAEGAIVAIPTETVYGLCVDPALAPAVALLRSLKGRDGDKPLAVLVPGVEAAAGLGVVPSWAEPMLADVWPGPLTVVLSLRDPALRVLGSEETIGVRVPDDAVALAVLERVGRPVAATSANTGGQRPLESAEEIAREFGEQVAIVLRAPTHGSGRPSSVVDLTSYPPAVLREGEVTAGRVLELCRLP